MAYLPLGGDADRRIIEIYARLNNLQGDLDKLKAQLALEKRNQSIAGNGSGGTGKVAVWSSDFELGASSILTESGGALTTTGSIVPSPTGTLTNGDGSHRWSDVETLTLHADHLDKAAASFIDIATNLRATADGGQDLGTGGVRFGKVFSSKFQYNTGTNGVFHTSGSGTPEGNVAADIGSTYSNITGGASTAFYVKESNTPDALHGWIAYGAAGAGGVNPSLSNLVALPSLTAINASLVPGSDNAIDLGAPTPQFWRIAYINQLIGNAAGGPNIIISSKLRPDDLSWSLGDSTHRFTDLYVAQQGSGRVYFSQTGTTPTISAGSTDPAGNTIVADKGSIYLRKGAGAGTSFYVKENDDGAGTGWTAMNPSGGAAPGMDTEIIFNTSGSFDADADLTWDKTNNVLTVASASGVIGTSGASSIIASRGIFEAEKGTAGTPTYTFRIDTGTGIRHGDSTNALRFCSNGADRWTIDANGNLIAATQNTVDIGQNGVTEPRHIYAGSSIYANTAGGFILGTNTIGVHTPFIDNSGSVVAFGDTLQPDGPNARNCGSNSFEWANVYSGAFRLASGFSGFPLGVSWTQSSTAPGGSPSRGAIHSRTSGGGPFYVYDGAVWQDILAAASGANKFLSNLTAPTSVSENLIPGGLKTLGDSGTAWSALYATTVAAGTIQAFSGPNLAINSHLVPSGDNTLDLTGTSNRFRDVGIGRRLIWTFPSASGVVDLAGSGDPNATLVSASVGSLYRRTNGTSNATLYIKETGGNAPFGWAAALTSTGTGSFADLQLSNLTGTTAVPVNLLPAGSGTLQIGSGSHRWGGCSINSIGCTSISGLSGSVTLFSDLIANGPLGTSLGNTSNYFFNTYSQNVLVTNVVPNTASGFNYVAIGQGSNPIYLYLGGSPRQVTTTPTATPLYVV